MLLAEAVSDGGVEVLSGVASTFGAESVVVAEVLIGITFCCSADGLAGLDISAVFCAPARAEEVTDRERRATEMALFMALILRLKFRLPV